MDASKVNNVIESVGIQDTEEDTEKSVSSASLASRALRRTFRSLS